MSNPATTAEHRDSLAHLASRGFAPLLAVLEDPAVYRKGNRINVAAIARQLGISWDRASAMLREAREAIE